MIASCARRTHHVLLALVALLLLAGCVDVEHQVGVSGVSVWHDDARGVTCWIYVGYGIECLSDSQLTQ